MSSRPQSRPLLMVVSSPSGGGKSTLCARLIAERPDFSRSVSCTTRKPRGDERHGRDYYFLSDAEFDRHVEKREFLEHAVVHGRKYGTLKKPVADALRAGRSIVMVIDVQGAAQVRDRINRLAAKNIMRRSFVDVFVEPPSLEALRKRLAGRGTDSGDEIERRMKNAETELSQRTLYSHRIVNDDLDKAYAGLLAIVRREQGS